MPGRGRRGGRGYGRRKQRVRLLEPVLLLALLQGPAHGYQLLEQLPEFNLDGIDPSVVYRSLRDMEAQELVTSAWDDAQSQGPPRRVYRLTRYGRDCLAEHVCDLQSACETMTRFVAAYQAYERV